MAWYLVMHTDNFTFTSSLSIKFFDLSFIMSRIVSIDTDLRKQINVLTCLEFQVQDHPPITCSIPLHLLLHMCHAEVVPVL